MVSGKGPGSLGEMRVVGFAMAGWDARVAEESSRGIERRWWVRRLAVCYVKLNTPIPESGGAQSAGPSQQAARRCGETSGVIHVGRLSQVMGHVDRE